MNKTKAKAEPAAPVITHGFKAFDPGFVCRGFQFEVGKTYEYKGKVEVCQSGFHYVAVPFDAWSYYPGSKTLARVSGVNAQGHDEDSKLVTAKLTIEASLTLPDWIKAQASAVVDLCRKAAGALAGKPRENAAATGDSGHAAATGDRGHAAATGDRGHAAATGNYGHAAATGNYGHAAATGNYGHAAATGDSGHAAATGDRGHAAATGKHSCAFAPGYAGRAMAGETGAIFLAEIADDWSIKTVFASKVGENGVKPNTWYRLENGKPVECP